MLGIPESTRISGDTTFYRDARRRATLNSNGSESNKAEHFGPRDKLTAHREFVDANNNDLLKNLGNLCQRVIKFCQAKMDGVVPEYDISAFPALQQHKEEVNKLLHEYTANVKATKLRAGLSTIMRYALVGPPRQLASLY